MASLIGSLFVSLTADFNPFQRNMKAAEGVVATTSSGMRRNIGLTEKSVSGLQRTMNSNIKPYALLQAGKAFDTVSARAGLLRGALFATTAAFGGLTAAISTNVFSRYVDQFTGLQNQLRTVSSGTADLNAQMVALQRVSEASRSSLSAVGTLYARLAKATPEEGAAKTLQRVQTISKGLQLGGATAQEAYSASIQLSQALASNRLGGEELRAVLETPLGNELAKGLGVSIGKFREMGFAGELTAKKIYQALDARAGTIDKQFAGTTATIDQSLTVLDSKITAYAGSIDKAYGVTKTLTGGINAFGNNLETIIPLLGNAAIGIGALFAGRLAGAKIGGGIGGVVAGVRGITEARKEAVRLAREDVSVAQTSLNIAKEQAAQAQKKAGGDVLAAAPKSAVSAYKRDLHSLQKADEAYLKNIDKKRQLNEQLAAVTKNMTAGEIKASQALAAQQQKLNDLRAKSVVPQQRRATAANRVVEPIADTRVRRTRGLEAAANEQVALANQIKKAEADLAAARQNYTDKYNASFTAAANQRAAILVNEKRLQADLAAAEGTRSKAAAAARTSGGAARGVGGAAIASEIEGTARAVAQAEAAVARAGYTFQTAQKGAGALATGIGLVRGAGASLVGFLGGPWGVAFTAAIGLMTYLGLRSQETAEKIANAQKIINETLAEAQQGPNKDAITPDVEVALQEDKIKAQTAELKAVTEELVRQKQGVVDALGTLSISDDILALPNPDQVFTKIQALATAFESGQKTIEDVKKELKDFGYSDEQIDRVTAAFTRVKGEVDKGNAVVSLLQAKLDALKGELVEIKVNIAVNDPAGILGGGTEGTFGKGNFVLPDIENSPINQTTAPEFDKIRGAAIAEEILNRAKKDTTQAIKDRTEAIFEENRAQGMSYEQAQQTAAAEHAIEEGLKKTKKEMSEGERAAKSAAKEYEKFASKLEELQASAQGSGLSDLDQQVLNFAESLKNGSQMMREYVEAINSGNLSAAPPELLKAREAFQQIGAGEAAKEIIQQYGTGAQVAQQFADKQEQLNMAVANGQITAQQAGVAFGDFVSTFGQYQWVDDMSNAFTNFANAALTDFDNIGEAAKNLLKDIANIILKAALLDPLKNSLTSFFGGIAAGGTGGGLTAFGGGKGGLLGGMIIPGILHSGGTAGVTKTPTRAVPAASFAGAPKFHSGIGSDEMAAILQKGETVLQERDANRWSNTMRGLSNKATAAPKPTKGDFQINVVGAKGNAEIREMVQQGISAGLEVYDRHQFPNSFKRVQDDPHAR